MNSETKVCQNCPDFLEFIRKSRIRDSDLDSQNRDKNI